jgi:hypothetical protein
VRPERANARRRFHSQQQVPGARQTRTTRPALLAAVFRHPHAGHPGCDGELRGTALRRALKPARARINAIGGGDVRSGPSSCLHTQNGVARICGLGARSLTPRPPFRSGRTEAPPEGSSVRTGSSAGRRPGMDPRSRGVRKAPGRAWWHSMRPSLAGPHSGPRRRRGDRSGQPPRRGRGDGAATQRGAPAWRRYRQPREREAIGMLLPAREHIPWRDARWARRAPSVAER